MDWEECCGKLLAKGVKQDFAMIKSLMKSSENKLKSELKLEMSEVTAASKLSLAYDSLRELLEALALKKGYKIYNHECYTAFLKEIMKESLRGDEFDDVRRARNSVNYYGKEISPSEAEKIIFKIKSLRDFAINLLKP